MQALGKSIKSACSKLFVIHVVIQAIDCACKMSELCYLQRKNLTSQTMLHLTVVIDKKSLFFLLYQQTNICNSK